MKTGSVGANVLVCFVFGANIVNSRTEYIDAEDQGHFIFELRH